MSDLPPLTPERRVELRNRVLAGERLDIEIVRQLVNEMRIERSAIPEKTSKKASPRKKAMTDDELDADLDLFIGRAAPAGTGDDNTAESDAGGDTV
jgi:hypothetical protein